MNNHQTYLSINPHIRFGKPCIHGTRISVYDVLSWYASGMQTPEIIADFPELNEKQLMACLAYAADRESKVRVAL